MDESTIISDSSFGKRLGKITKHGAFMLSYSGKDMPIVGKITIGRDAGNTIQINDNLASRYHALVQKIKNAYFIKDLDSTNGTFVNDKQIEPDKYVLLKKKDKVLIGRTQIIVQ
ncbi:MAG: FHA domain-containing protein [Spirochaetales bacterium]|nr:FHA domain-containing protein [Spirochaetales bacterium]